MHYWLVKSEPLVWSWSQQEQKGIECWDGVRNYQAANYMKQMEMGDLAFFYHSGNIRSIVGIVKVVRTYYPDGTDPTGKFGMVDFQTVCALAGCVSLKEIKSRKDLEHMELVRQSRLSVQRVCSYAWERILQVSGTKV